MHKYLGTTYLYACIPLVEDLISRNIKFLMVLEQTGTSEKLVISDHQ